MPAAAIPVTIRQQRNVIHYRSAIALALAKNQSDGAIQIAQTLMYHLQQQLSPELVQVQSIDPAWIELTLTEQAIQQWLQQCLSQLPFLTLSFPSTVTTLSFPQYIHHRCCRLLQLGAEENLISLTDYSGTWNNCSFAGQNLLQGEDWRLIYQLIYIVDQLDNPSSKPIPKLATNLSDALTRFHRYCRMFDRQQANFPQIAIIRLNLVAMTKGLLQEMGY